MWVRDFRPNARQKWLQGIVLVPVGRLQYDVSIKGSNTKKVHVDHLLKRVSQVVREVIKPGLDSKLDSGLDSVDLGNCAWFLYN